MVLFFDNSTMDLSDQPRARAAAAKFIDAYAGPDRVMSVMNFGGTLQIVQNFTTDCRAVEAGGGGNLDVERFAKCERGQQVSLWRRRQMRELRRVGGWAERRECRRRLWRVHFASFVTAIGEKSGANSGRKSLMLFTAGFELSPERYSELTATIDTCNKANVAVYPIDVRGLVTPMCKATPRSERNADGAQTQGREES